MIHLSPFSKSLKIHDFMFPAIPSLFWHVAISFRSSASPSMKPSHRSSRAGKPLLKISLTRALSIMVGCLC